MHHIVAVEVKLETGERRYFLTWGRIQDRVDPVPLARIVLRHAARFAIEGEPASARVLWSLHPAVDTPYFWDCFFDMCQSHIPFGEDTYPEWRDAIAAAQEERGEEIWYLGHWSGDERPEQPDDPDATVDEVRFVLADVVCEAGTVGTVEFLGEEANGPMLLAGETGYASNLPPGRYRVRIVRLWDREPYTWCAAGDLLDDADIETARQAGASTQTPLERITTTLV